MTCPTDRSFDFQTICRNNIFNHSLPWLYKIFIHACYSRSIEKEHIMFLMWIIPLLILGLIVYGVSGNGLVNAFKSASNRACPHCHQPVQSDWKNCPHCGQTL